MIGSELATNTVPGVKEITELDMISIILVHGYNITLQMIPSNEAERMCQDSSSSPNGQVLQWFGGMEGRLAEILDIMFSFRSCGDIHCSLLQLTSLLTIYYPHLEPT